jgi:hypothetical protein
MHLSLLFSTWPLNKGPRATMQPEPLQSSVGSRSDMHPRLETAVLAPSLDSSAASRS